MTISEFDVQRTQRRTLPSVLEAVGDTPLVELTRVFDEAEGRVLAKLEFLNPTLSRADRVARQIIEDAQAEKRLAPFQTVVEATSGNTGAGLAMACAVLRHPFIAVMSTGSSPERAAMIRAYGAEVILVEQAPGGRPGEVSGADRALVEARAAEIVHLNGAFLADQFKNVSSFRAHRLYTGPEILRQTAGRLDAFCDFVGSGGTLAGCAAAFKEFDARILCYAVEPSGAAVLAGRGLDEPRHGIEGGGYGRADLPLLDRDRIDGYLAVSAEEARAEATRLAAREGLFVGLSSGANVAAARQLLRGPLYGKTIVVVLADTGMKSLSSSVVAAG
jgi:cysteine synthase A